MQTNVPSSQIPETELPILDNLIRLRQRLSILKKDRKKAIDGRKVDDLYAEIVDQISQLEAIRANHSPRDQEKNRVDFIIDDSLQLISLFYFTIGRPNSTPACYAQITTLKRLLDHWKEIGQYTENDLKPIRQRLNEMHKTIDVEAPNYPAAVNEIYRAKLDLCEESYQKTEKKLNEIAPELQEVVQKIVAIKRRVNHMSSFENLEGEEYAELEMIINDIKSLLDKRDENKNFVDEEGKAYKGSEICSCTLEELSEFAYDMKNCKGVNLDLFADPAVKSIFEHLMELKNQLERLLLTYRWTLRETDLYNYKTRLTYVDALLKSDKIVPYDSKSRRILLYIVRRCYALIYKLLSVSEPVSEALMPIHNQLQTVKRCLSEIQQANVPLTDRDLYPFQLKLQSIDSLSKDGKFLCEGDIIPEGQGAIRALLEECYEYIAELRNEASSA